MFPSSKKLLWKGGRIQQVRVQEHGLDLGNSVRMGYLQTSWIYCYRYNYSHQRVTINVLVLMVLNQVLSGAPRKLVNNINIIYWSQPLYIHTQSPVTRNLFNRTYRYVTDSRIERRTGRREILKEQTDSYTDSDVDSFKYSKEKADGWIDY
jgi:hypothetical protein